MAIILGRTTFTATGVNEVALTAQQVREKLAQAPQADGIDPDTGTVVYKSQLMGDHYMSVIGPIHRSHIVKRWHVGLPSLGI